MSQSLKRTDHNALINRNAKNQHDIGAIEGLRESLDGIQVDILNLQTDIDNKVPMDRKINGQTLENDVEVKNVESADKLKTARTIGLNGAVTSTPTAFDGSEEINIPITALKESYLEWGGKNLAHNISPLDSAMLPELNANRLSFIKNSAVKFERSEDAGNTWVDVSNEFDGTTICTKSTSFGNGNKVSNQSVNRQHRITIDCVSGNVYCMLAKIMLQISTEGATGCKCTVEFGDKAENTQWTTYTTANLNGWSGWNVINVNHVVGIEYISWDKSYRYVRLTFKNSYLDSNFNCDLIIKSIRFISKFLYDAPSVMAFTGHLYSYDKDQNATFPKNLLIQGNTLKIGNTTLTETQLQALLKLI